MEQNEHAYTLPENTDASLKKMMLWLLGCFGLLICLVLVVVINAETLAAHVPFSAEQKFVRPYEQAIQQWYPKKTNVELDAYLERLVTEVSTALTLPEDMEIQVHYVDSKEVNAFATLGGHIFVFRGLMEVMPNENALTMVLAHEIAHIKHRDPIASMGRGLAIQMLYSFVTNDYSSSVDLVGLTGNIGSSFFSREQEKQADLAALDGLNTHYGHVSGYDTFFKFIAKEIKEDTKILEWLSSHPDIQRRIDYLTEQVIYRELPMKSVKLLPENINQLMDSTLKSTN